MTTVDTNLSIEELVGEMESPRCGEELHSTLPNVHADGGEMYINWHGHMVVVFCGKWLAYLTEMGWVPAVCRHCDEHALLGSLFTAIGPVEK